MKLLGSNKIWIERGPGMDSHGRITTSHVSPARALAIGPVRALAVSPDSSYLASAGDDGSVRVWDLASGRERVVLRGDGGPVRALVVSPDGSYLASAGDDGSVRVWDPLTGSLIWTSLSAAPVRALVVSPDGSYLASAGDDGSVQAWDPLTGSLIWTSLSAGPVRALVVGPGGSYLASAGDDGSVRVWDLASGRERVVLAGDGGPVRALVVSPDGSYLASAGDDGSVRVWDLASGRERVVLAGDAGPVRALVVSPDGSYLASAGHDGSVRAWNLAKGAQVILYRTEPTAFISYAHEDRLIADRLRQLLARTGLAVWSDEKIPLGSSIAGQIERAIRASDVIFFVSSTKSNNSPAVNAELAMAISERNRNPRKVIIPVLANDADSIPPLLSDIAGFNINSDEEAIDKLSRLGRQLSAGEDIPLRTEQDRVAQFDLINAELAAIEVETRSYRADSKSREFNLGIRVVTGIGFALVLSFGILGLFFAIGNHNTSAWLVTIVNLTVALAVYSQVRDWRKSSRSVLASRSRDDNS